MTETQKTRQNEERKKTDCGPILGLRLGALQAITCEMILTMILVLVILHVVLEVPKSKIASISEYALQQTPSHRT